LCARENLPSLALYACDAQRNWVRLPAQSFDAESRTFTADDDQGPSMYAILGPGQFRAQRLVIPGETADEAASTKPESPSVEPVPVPPAEQDAPSESEPGMKGVPPKHSRAPIAIPKEATEPKADEPPRLNLDIPKKLSEEKKSGSDKKGPKRNFHIQKSVTRPQDDRRDMR
ncbi:MAG: hypothetical protein NTU83_14565, partial [Candidatus Hydrogenedentes bacterium]|nr:hypothetical protein [Candidatus Hydrogenedentota bacterium]